jgi:hypothetical protein
MLESFNAFQTKSTLFRARSLLLFLGNVALLTAVKFLNDEQPHELLPIGISNVIILGLGIKNKIVGLGLGLESQGLGLDVTGVVNTWTRPRVHFVSQKWQLYVIEILPPLPFLHLQLVSRSMSA